MNWKRLFFGLAILSTAPASAQNMLGISGSPYGGTHSAHLNPAFLADSPHQFYLNLAAGSAHLNNNYVRYNGPYSLLAFATGRVPDTYKRPDGSLLFKVEYTDEILNGREKSGSLLAEIRGPSALFRVSDRVVLGLTTRLRSANQFKNADEEILSVIRLGLQDQQVYNIPNRDNQFSFNSNTFTELGLALGATLLEDDYQKISVGATVKRVRGLASGHLINRGLNYRILTDPATNEIQFQVDQLDAQMGYTTYLSRKGRSLRPRDVFTNDNPGSGWGLDLGLSYQLLDQDDPNRYRLRLGASLMDVGSVRYADPERKDVESYRIQEINSQFTEKDFFGVKNTDNLVDVLRERLNLTPANNLGEYRSGLPTALVLSADMLVGGNLYLSGTLIQDMRPRFAVTMHQPSLLSVAARYETPRFGLSLPVTYLNQAVVVGGSVRLGPFFAGTENLLGLIGSSSSRFRPRGADVYAGLTFSALRQKP